MSTLNTIIITYYLLIIIVIITKSHNNYCSVGVMVLCLLNLLILIDCFFCNSYPCVLFESLSHMINQESRLFMKFGENLPRSFFEILKSPLFHLRDFKISKKWTQVYMNKRPLCVLYSDKKIQNLMDFCILLILSHVYSIYY